MSITISRRDLFTNAAVAAGSLAVLNHPLGRLLSAGDTAAPLHHRPLRVGAFCGYKNYPNSPYETKADARARVTALIGGTLPVERNFFPYDTPVQADIPSISTWAFPPSEMIAGVHDDEVTATILANPSIRWTCNNHEPDQSGRGYSPADYVASAQHFYGVVKAADPTVKVGTILMQWSVVFGGKDWTQWYPGDAYTDYLGWDVYFEPWQGAGNTAHRMLDPIIAINASIGKPLLLPELGIGVRSGTQGSFTDAQKDTFLTDTLAILSDPAMPVPVRAVAYFYTNKVDGDWTLDSWPTTLGTLNAAAVTRAKWSARHSGGRTRIAAPGSTSGST